MFEARRFRHTASQTSEFLSSIQLTTIDFTWLPWKHQSLLYGKQHFRQKASQANMVTLKRVKLPPHLRGEEGIDEAVRKAG